MPSPIDMIQSNHSDSGAAVTKGKNLRAIGDRIEALIQEISRVADPAVRDKTEDLVRLVMELYGGAFARILEIADEHEPALIDRLAADDLIASLLILHGLHPLDVETRIERALDRVRPYLFSHGGDIKLLGVRDGVVALCLEGTCHGCPSSTLTMKLAVEKAIEEAAPEVARIEVEGELQSDAASPADGTAGGQNGHKVNPEPQINDGAWMEIGKLPELAACNLAGKEIAGINVVICRIDETVFAYQDCCPSCGAALRAGNLRQSVLTCSSCGRGFDVRRAGRCTDMSELHMEPLPVLAQESGVRIAVPAMRF
jgi:Fe-S cluster biogenesis protein NfuA/nitrite reductase/ring-hydroxylating ferredoxin subunit